MIRPGAVAVFLFVGLAAGGEEPPPSPGDQLSVADWEHLVATAEEARKSKDYALALSSLEDANRLAERLGDEGRRISTLEAIAWIYHGGLGQDLQALPYWEEAWKLRVANGTTLEESGWYMRGQLEQIYRRLGQWEKVEPLARERLRESQLKWEQKKGDAAGVISRMLKLAYLVDRARPGDPEVEALYRESIELADEAGAESWVNFESFYSRAAGYYEQQGRYAEAIELLRQAIEWLEKEPRRDLEKLSRYHRRLSTAHAENGHPELAEHELRQALALAEEHYGADHRDLTWTLREMGGLLAAQERYEEAADPVRRAIAILERTRGPQAELRQSLRGLERRARGDLDAPLGEIVHEFGMVEKDEVDKLRDRGEWHAALELAEKKLAAAEAEHGPDSLQVADALRVVGSLYRANSIRDAVAVYERRLRILHDAAGIADRRVASHARYLAEVYSYHLPKLERVEELQRLRIESLLAAGAQRLSLAEAYADLAKVQQRRRHWIAAAESFELAAEIWLDLEGPDAEETLELRGSRAYSLLEVERHQEAEVIFLELVDRLERHPSRSAWVCDRLVAALGGLARLYRETGREPEAVSLVERRDAACG